MKILVVEDSAEKIALIKRILEKEALDGEQIDIVGTGLDAREKLSQKKYDLLILDIAIPLRERDSPDKRGGINLLIEIERSARFIKPTNVLALTGYQELQLEFQSKFNDGLWNIEYYDPSDEGWRERLFARLSYIRSSLSQTGSYDQDVCIITALPSPELDAVRRLPWSFEAAKPFDTVSFSYSGRFLSNGITCGVTAISAPRMGMVASASLATKVVHLIRPRILIMAGICAGLPEETEIGDLILADPTWDWQMGKYKKENFDIQPDFIGCPIEISQKFEVMKGNKHEILELAESFLGDKPRTIPEIHIGPMATGSAVIANDEVTKSILLQHRKVIAVDMEMYGIYSAVRDCASPKPIVFGAKAVCDHADQYKNDKYQMYAAHISAGLIRMFLERYCSEFM